MAPAVLSFGRFRLDPGDRALWRDGARLRMAPKCLALLEVLVANAGRLVTKDQLLEAVWPNTHVVDSVLKVRMQELRAALGDDADQPRYIETVHRHGYRFVGTVVDGDATSVMSTVAPASELAGRAMELATLRHHVDQARAGRRQMLFISGEAGVGKTALVDVFLSNLPKGAMAGRGQCLDQHGSGEAYLPIFEAVADLARGPRGSEIVSALRLLAPTWLVQLPWLVAPGDRDALAREVAGATRERMLREMAHALETLADGEPLVLVVEDLHWSDPSTLDLLSLLGHRRGAARLMVIGTYRPVDAILSGHPLRVVRQRLIEQRLASDIALGLLRSDDVRSLLEGRFENASFLDTLTPLVMERTAGNPLFVGSLLDHAIEQRWIERSPEGWSLSVLPDRFRDEVPYGVRDMIAHQFERLADSERLVLEAASVVGEAFSVTIVAEALECPVATVDEACQATLRYGHILRANDVPEHGDRGIAAGLAFAHALHRDVLYRGIPDGRRAHLHRRIGECLERAGAGPEEIAEHYVQGASTGCGAEAVRLSRLAAEREASRFAYAEAAEHYRRALGTWDAQTAYGEQDRCATLMALARAEERSGDFTAARASLDRAAAIARAHGFDTLLAEAALGVRVHVIPRVDSTHIALLEEALVRLPHEHASLRARTLARLDAALSPIREAFERRRALSAEALQIAQATDDPATLLDVLTYARWGFIGRERRGDLRDFAARLLALGDASTPPERSADAQLMRVSLLGEAGDMDAARDALDVFTRNAEVMGMPWFEWFAVRIRALHAMQEGDFAQAERSLAAALPFADRMDHPNVRPLHAIQALHLAWLRQDPGSLIPALEPRLAQSEHDVGSRVILAQLYVESGRRDDAQRALVSLAANGFANVPRNSTWLISLATLSSICAMLGDRAHAALLYEHFAPHAERMIGVGPSVVSLGWGTRYLGLLAAMLGRWDEADTCLASAAAEHERAGAKPWLALTLADQADLVRRRPGRDSAARRRREDALRTESLAMAQAIGMGPLVQRLGRTGSI